MLRYVSMFCALINVLCASQERDEVIPKCPKGYWTKWFNRDDPSGHGDYELLSKLKTENPGKICPVPSAVHARLVDDRPYTDSGELVTIGPSIGIYCNNCNQTDGKCEDYKVRFCCYGAASCPNKKDWTQWFERNVSYGYYDLKNFSAIRHQYSKVCASPVAAEYEKECVNYKVRFCCPIGPFPCHPDDWTMWFDRNNSNGCANYGSLSALQLANPGKICQYPTGVEVQTVDGEPYTSTGDILSIGPLIGVICNISDQDDNQCAEYRVRFCCKKPPTCRHGRWTQWFNRDNPGGSGDWESLSLIRKAYPHKVCRHPTAVDAQLISGAPYAAGGDILILSASQGLICKNRLQRDWKCNDYRVRFCCPKVVVPPSCPHGRWTQWFNRDNPGGSGDWENLSSIRKAYPHKVCKRPTAVDAQLTSGAPYTACGDILILSPSKGLICINKRQPDKKCCDYRVRFCCPKVVATPSCRHGSWTQWFNRDNPGGSGDWETLKSIRKAYRNKVCKRPTAIDARLATGAPYTDGGDILTVSPSKGLICKNKRQRDRKCNDYKVRFCCR